MTSARTLCAPLAALLVAACSGEPSTAVPIDALGLAESLRLFVPSLTHDDLVAKDDEAPADTDGPALVQYGDEEAPLPDGSTSEADISDYLDEVGAIYDAMTKVGFGSGYGFSYGEHKYQGNKGRVETTVSVAYRDQSIGTQTAASEKYDMFLLDAGTVHFISATARFYSDQTCGLTVRGHSQHYAWWEWFLGGSATSWGRVSQYSDAPSKSQGDCPVGPASGGGGSGGSGDGTCYYWVSYDLNTGEVYDVSFLYCEVGG